MNLPFRGYLFVLAVTVFAVCAAESQVRTKEERLKTIADLAEDEKAVAACLRVAREEQIRKFGKPLPKIAGHCWDGCPIRVAKPYYPDMARRLKIRGEVLVDTVVDEKGNVVFAKIAKGNSHLRRAALDAAYVSQYQPKVPAAIGRLNFAGESNITSIQICRTRCRLQPMNAYSPAERTSNPIMKTTTLFLSILLTVLLSAVVSGQQKPTTNYAPVNGLKMYYEVHGSGEPVVLLHGAFMSGDWK